MTTPRDYIDSDPNAVPDDEEENTLPVPAGESLLGTWQYALPMFLRLGKRRGVYSKQTKRQYTFAVRWFFAHGRMAVLRLNELEPLHLQAFHELLVARTQPGFTAGSAAARAAHGAALVLWAPPGPESRQRPRGGRGTGALATASVNQRLVALRAFFHFCRKRGWLAPALTADVIDEVLANVEDRPPLVSDILQEHEFPGFADAARAAGRTDGSKPVSRRGYTGKFTHKRDYCIVRLFESTGIRRGELVNLNIGNFSPERRADGTQQWWMTLESEQTKGGYGARSIPITSEVIADLTEYLKATGRTWKERGQVLFLSTRPSSGGGTRRLTGHQINIVFDRVDAQHKVDTGDELDSRHIHPHSLRASVAVAITEGNEAKGRPPAGLLDTQTFLGHNDPKTTEIYLKRLNVRKRLAPLALNPGNPDEPTPAEPDEEEGA